MTNTTMLTRFRLAFGRLTVDAALDKAAEYEKLANYFGSKHLDYPSINRVAKDYFEYAMLIEKAKS